MKLPENIEIYSEDIIVFQAKVFQILTGCSFENF